MQVRRLGLFVVLAVVSPVFGQWESGSDGSDGAYSPAVSTLVDLSLAASVCDCDGDTQVDDPCRWDCPSPVAGQGVYDAEQWAVVFKHTTIDIPAGVTVTFQNHPSGAPVVWLASEDATINGTVSLNGKNGTTIGPIPAFAEPGPGGWAGGQRGHGGGILRSVGHGPGGTDASGALCGGLDSGLPASHLVRPSAGGVTSTNSKTYDNSLPFLSPLHGGAGGTASNVSTSGGGGGGGGAILIACGSSAGTEILTLGSSAIIRANGGDGAGSGVFSSAGGGGSGGVVRLRAPTISVTTGAQVAANSGAFAVTCNNTTSPNGGIRIEADMLSQPPITSPTATVVNAASPVFATDPPALRIVSVDSVIAPLDPEAGLLTTDVFINNSGSVILNIEGEGFPGSPASVTVQVRVTPARGAVTTASATLTDPEPDGIYTGSASLASFSSGRSEVQVRWPVPP